MLSPIAPLLEQARAAVAKRQPELALTPLLRAWTNVRDIELAAVIERLSEQLSEARPPLAGATRAAVEQSWRDRAERADAIELGLLLASLADTDSHQARRRLKLIARHAPDPRIATALTSIVLSPPFTSSSTAKFWQTLHELLRACPDPRALARLERAPALEPSASSTLVRLDAWRRRSVESLRIQLEGLRVTLTADERARVEEIATLLDATESEASRDAGPELLAAIVEAPAELERRSVYADYLLGLGDPRGEFIALQLAESRGELDRAGRARANALLAEHGMTWPGLVGRALVRGRTSYRNGFIHVARIKTNHRGLEQLLDAPEWATVETLEHAPLRLVCAPIMRSLRSLRWTARQLVSAASEPDLELPNIEALTIESDSWQTGWAGRAGIHEQLRAALEQARVFPGLRRLAVEFDASVQSEQLAWMWSGPLGERLRELELQLDGDGGIGLVAYLRSLRRARSEPGLERVRVENRLLRCRFERVAGAWSRVRLEPGPDAQTGAIQLELELLREIDNLELVLDARLADVSHA